MTDPLGAVCSYMKRKNIQWSFRVVKTAEHRGSHVEEKVCLSADDLLESNELQVPVSPDNAYMTQESSNFA